MVKVLHTIYSALFCDMEWFPTIFCCYHRFFSKYTAYDLFVLFIIIIIIIMLVVNDRTLVITVLI